MPQKIDFTNDQQKQPISDVKVSSSTSKETILTLLKESYQNKILFTIQEVSEILGMSYDYIAKQIRNGNIDAVRFGDRPLVNIEVLSLLILTGIQNG
ncbi:MAG: excisionase family DNA-binding protein [Melioribacteraceae bacterium]|nr:excisionase family DNA-binding protein [Melioribacteraceae bacterium]